MFCGRRDFEIPIRKRGLQRNDYPQEHPHGSDIDENETMRFRQPLYFS
jgi:hypothetical protein